ncbi:PSD1 and planctomycete cytochrome C domain-containing protein [Thalassoglobus neptunius]|uniref:PSD1 and planctomycete cytochrome C domain-containing protein n=1 Tax=Thalassoglobus neptunius TaxID=1938619 RepID=UPI001E55F10D|nr:PSD1 and planctomycete cytochrome C domain-containing protein [Thalassoglobus neptunius]
MTNALLADSPSYNRDIRPILSDKCFYCHGPDEEDRQADLRLDDEAAAKQIAITPGSLEESLLIQRILSDDEFEKMPPPDSGKELSESEIQLLSEWIQSGAEYEPYWAYVAPRDVPAPDSESHTDWATTEIDRFISARLAKESLSPSPPADSVTLVRRLYFDLIGLPPTSETIEQFAESPSEESYEKLVDELLASRHFGERMAAYWLDLVRFADTVGYHGDQDHNISPYRDWVISAFNSDMPFDEFTKSQLAGDLINDEDLNQLIASGYNRLLQTSHEGGLQPKEYLAIYAADRVRNLSAVWMGATVGCAQCHNHKYDPYTIEDFYSLAAFFADVDEAQHFKLGSNALPTRRPPEIPIFSPEQKERLQEIDDSLSKLTEEDSEERSQLESEKKSIEKSARWTMITKSIEPRTMRVLPRGNWLDDSGPVVQPAIPRFLGQVDHEGERATRLDLANWLTDPTEGVGGLTARVQANRIWYLLFGTGLSRSLDDFGGQGEPPSHPELLDYLALQFIDSDWSIKKLMKQIVMSQTYRQSSVASETLRSKDPENQLFARQGSFRLPAEMVRDNALVVSGLLNDEFGGSSAKPYQPSGYYRHLNFPTREYEFDKDRNQYRRGVYMHWQRQFLHPMLKAFDAPSREECTAQRPRSNTPLAALVLMNDPTFVEAGRAFAERILTEAEPEESDRIQFAFNECLSRNPDPVEQEILIDLLERSRKVYQQDVSAADQLLEVGLAPVEEVSNKAELAAWTTVARAILNLNETITRN